MRAAGGAPRRSAWRPPSAAPQRGPPRADGLELAARPPAGVLRNARAAGHHALLSEDEHRKEREVGADDHQAQLELAQALAQEGAGDLGKPVVDAGEEAEH